jgi:hypothetical protein
MLSKTWYVGFAAAFYRVAESDAAGPGTTFTSAGLHIGFDIRRKGG